MRKLSLLALSVLFTCATSLRAQEESAIDEGTEESKLEFSGSVDAYYRTTLNTTDNDGYDAPPTSFANGTGFTLGMVNLIAAKEGEKSGFVADLVFGPRGDEAVFGSVLFGNNDAIVNQLYAYWNVSDKVTLTIGNFNTFLGYEVISPASNFNYSTSYMFSYGPFSHTGLKADFALSDELSAMVAIMNPTDATTTAFQNMPTLGFQLGYSNDNGGAWLNVLYGDQDGEFYTDTAKASFSGVGTTSNSSTFQIDLTTGWDVSDELYVGFNATYNTNFGVDTLTNLGGDIGKGDKNSAASFYGAALYLQYALSDDFSLGLRGEYFSDNSVSGILPNGYTPENADDLNPTESVIDLTLSANYSIGDLTLIPEFRVDMFSDNNAISDKKGNAAGGLASFALAAVYSF